MRPPALHIGSPLVLLVAKLLILFELAAAQPSTASAPGTESEALKTEALTAARAVADAYPNDPLAYALLGSAFYNVGQSDLASTHLLKCIDLDTNQAEAYQILGRIAFDRGRLEDATRYAREALKRGPPNPENLNLLGRSLMDAGKTEEAVRVLQQSTSLPGADGESFYLLGQALMQSGKYEQAKTSFLAGTTRVPDHTQAFFGLYMACMRLGQTEEADRHRQMFQKLESADRTALRDRSSDAKALSGLPLVRQTVARTIFGAGQVYRVHQENDKAVALIRRAALLDPDNPAYRAALEAHFLQLKTLEQAVPVFEQLVKEQPVNPWNYLFLARVYMRLQRVQASEEAFLKVQELAPQWPDGYKGLAELYLRANRNFAEVRKLAEKIVLLEATGSNYYLLGIACLKADDRAGAIKAMEQAVRLTPGEKRYQQFLQELQSSP